MSPRRTATGGRIDRARTDPLHLRRHSRITGHPGDTLASALLANGVTLFGRSFKYHRPRGVLSAGVDEPNALVTVLRGEVREPNIPATMVEIYDGLTRRQPEPLSRRSPSTSARSTSSAASSSAPASTTRPSWGRCSAR